MKNKGITFFDNVFYAIYYIYDKYVYDKDLRSYYGNNISQIHSIVILTFFQWLSLFYVLIGYTWFYFSGLDINLLINLSGAALILFINLKMYTKKRIHIIMNNEKRKKKLILYIIYAVVYFSITFYLFLKVGDYIHDSRFPTSSTSPLHAPKQSQFQSRPLVVFLY